MGLSEYQQTQLDVLEEARSLASESGVSLMAALAILADDPALNPNHLAISIEILKASKDPAIVDQFNRIAIAQEMQIGSTQGLVRYPTQMPESLG